MGKAMWKGTRPVYAAVITTRKLQALSANLKLKHKSFLRNVVRVQPRKTRPTGMDSMKSSSTWTIKRPINGAVWIMELVIHQYDTAITAVTVADAQKQIQESPANCT